jgi:hypothetical protein
MGEAKWGDYFSRIVSSGVVRGAYSGSANGDLKLYADSTGMQSKIGPGVVLIKGFMGETSGITALTHNAAHATQHRYDRIVARLSTVSPYTISLEILEGPNASSQGAALTAIRTLTSVDIPIGYVYIAPTVPSLALSAVTVDRAWTDVGSSWTTYSPTLTVETGSSFSIASSSVARAEYRMAGSVCEVSAAGLVALAGANPGGVLVSLPVPPKYVGTVFSADAFNQLVRCKTATQGGVWYAGMWVMLGPTFTLPTDGVGRGWQFNGRYRMADS